MLKGFENFVFLLYYKKRKKIVSILKIKKNKFELKNESEFNLVCITKKLILFFVSKYI